MKRLKFICFLLLLLCMACKQKKVEMPTEVTYDSLAIKVDYPYLSDYTSPRSCYRGDALYVVAYNHLTHAYDFIDLSGGGKHWAVSLHREGKDGVSASSDILALPKAVLAKETTGFKWLDDNGNVLNSKQMIEAYDSIGENLYSMLPHGAMLGGRLRLAFDSVHREVVFPLFPSSDLALEHRRLGGKMNVEDGTFSFLPDCYPSMFSKETQNMGSFFVPQFTACGDRIVYNFYGFSKFWVLSPSGKGEVKEYDMPSRYTDNQTPVPPASTDVWTLFKQELIALRFCEVHYIAPLRCYVRVHYAPKQNRKDPLVSYLMFMNEEGTTLYEYPLPSSFTEKYFIEGTDLYFFLSAKDGDNEMLLGRIRLGDYVGK